MHILRKLLWVDCIAATLGGVLVLALSAWLSRLHSLPHDFLLFIGAVNLLYAAYSFSLAIRAQRPPYLIKFLVFANLTWSVACVGFATLFAHTATFFGLAHLLGEAIFVGGLARLQWSQLKLVVIAG